MKKENECGIVEDLLPLYKEGLTRPDTSQFIEEHLAACGNCRSRLAELEAGPMLPPPMAERAPLAALRRRMLQTRLRAAAMAALLAAAILCSVFGYLTAPQYLTREQAQLAIVPDSQQEHLLRLAAESLEQKLTALLDEKAAPAPEADPTPPVQETDTAAAGPVALLVRCGGAWHAQLQSQPAEGGGTTYTLTAWNTLLDGWGPAGEHASLTIPWQVGDSLYYTPNDGTESVLLYGSGLPDGGGLVTLPRLALGWYLLAAAGAAVAFGGAWALLRKKKAAPVLGALFWAPVCYLAGHLLVKGPHTLSYNLPRDLSLILLIALLLWSTALLAAALWRARPRG